MQTMQAIPVTSDLTDAELIGGIAAKDNTYLAEAYRRFGGAVHGLAHKILRDRLLAEEVTQEVMLKLWHRPDRFDPSRGSLRSFILAHVHSRCVDVIRSETSRRIREEREARLTAEAGLSIEEEVWQMALSDHVRNALADLEERERRAIELAYFGGYTYREVARLLDAPEGTVKSRIRSGLKNLGNSLKTAGLAHV